MRIVLCVMLSPMSLQIVDVDEREVRQVTWIEEGHTSDVKAVEVGPAKLTRSMAAFANAEGGELFIGVDEG